MKACVLVDNNKIEYKEVDTPEIKSGEVLLKVGACGICSSDFNRVYNNGAYFYPLILGHEFSGRIVDCADDVDKDYTDKKAVVFPLLPCNECEFCKQKHYAQCSKYSYFGSRQNGAMAEYIAVPLWNIKIIPEDMPFEVAALCEPAAVAVHTAEKIGEIKNKTVCISGTGAIGIMCGIYLKSKGAKVTFIVRNEKKKSFLQSIGFTDFTQETQENMTFDVLIECVGSKQSLLNTIKFVKSRGTIILTGNPASDMLIEKKLYWKILRSEIVVKGIWNSSYKNAEVDDWDKAIEFLYENKDVCKKLLTDKFKLSDGKNAFDIMKSGSHFSLKGVFINE